MLTEEQVEFLLNEVRKMEHVERREELIKEFRGHTTSIKLHRVLIGNDKTAQFEVTKIVDGSQVSKRTYTDYTSATVRFDNLID